jgi:WD40 repeat protein/tRNA A-37 threonylcarbamoyl transferase component Bud32
MVNGSPNPREQRVQQVIAAYREAEQAGVAPDRDELLRRHPDLASELQAYFAERERPAQPAATGEFRPDNPAEAPTLAPGECPGVPAGTARSSFGDYELLEEIARGGMGVIYKARQSRLNRLVALKMILAGQLASPADIERFRMEAEAAAGLDHPNIVPIYEVGEYQGQPYFSMKLIEGGSLAQALSGGQWAVGTKQAQRRAARLIVKVARAVHYAHQRRILHRDLKPANILLDNKGEPHVTDFGLAKRVAGNARLTQSGAVVGTPSYMAPEQARAEKALSTAVDVYSLGAILYELLAGRPPFHAATPLDTLLQVMEREPVRPGSYEPDTNADLETICLKCLEKDPARRYGSAEALAEDLERWLKGEPIKARRSGVVERAAKWAKRRPAIAALTALVVLVTCLGVGGIVWNWQNARAMERKALDLAATQAAAWRHATSAQEREASARQSAEQALAKETEARAAEKKAKEQAEAERDAKAQALTRAEGLRIAAESAAAQDTDPGLSLLLAIEGVQRVPSHLTYHALYAALNGCREERSLKPHLAEAASMRAAHYSPEGRLILTLAGYSHIDDRARIWDAATGKLLAGWRGYLEPTGVAEFSPDGKLVAATMEGHSWAYYDDGQNPPKALFTDRTTYLWDAATGREVVHLRKHQDRVVSVRFSPDGQQIVTASWDKTARIWDVATGKLLHVLQGHKGSLLLAAFSPDGRRVLTLSSGKVEESYGSRKEFVTPKEAPEAEGDPGVQDRKGRFSSTGGNSHRATTAKNEDRLARLWDVATGQEIAAFTKRPDLPFFRSNWYRYPTAAAFSPDGNRVVIAFTDNAAAVWDAAGGPERLVLQGHEGAVQAATFSPNSKQIATASADRTVRLWDAGTGKELLRLRGHQRPVRSVQFSRDGTLLVTASDDRTARLWDARTGEERAVLNGHQEPVRSAEFHPDGRHVVTAGDNTARIWKVTPPQDLALILKGHLGAVHSLAFSPDGRRLLTAAEDETPRLWDSDTGKEVLALGKGKLLGAIRSARFSGDGRCIVTASASETVFLPGKVTNPPSAVHVWDAATGADQLALKEHGTGAAVAILSPDGKRVLTESDRWTKPFGLTRLWDAATGKLLTTLPKPMELLMPVFSPDGQWLLVHYAGESMFRLVDAATGKQDRPLRWGQMEGPFYFGTFSADGRRVATLQGQGVYLWDAGSGRLLATLKGFGSPVVFATFSPDGKHLATLSKNVAHVWNPETRELVQTLKGHEAEVVAAAFSPDGTQLLTGSKDRTAVLWDIATGKMLSLYEGHTDAVTRVAFRPDGRQVATASADGTARLWPVDLWPAILPRRPRELTQAERDRYELPAAVAQAEAPKGPAADKQARGPFAEPPPGTELPEILSIPPPTLEQTTEQELAGQLRQIEGQLKAGADDREATRLRLLALQANHPGTPAATQAAALLAKLPSPYDGLDAAQIPEEERFPWQPKELVAVLGEHRLRHWGDVERVAVSPDGRLVATGGQDHVIRLWDNATLRQQAELPGRLAGFSADGHTLIGLAEDRVRFWDIAQAPPRERSSFKAGNRSSILALSPDGKSLALRGEGGTIVLWDLTEPQPRQRATLPGHQRHVQVAAFSADGRTLASGGADGLVRLWDLKDDRPAERGVLKGHEKNIRALAFTPDGAFLASSGEDNTVRAWNLAVTPPRERAVWFEGKLQSAPGALAFSPDGTTLTVPEGFHGGPNTITLWAVTEEPPRARAQLHGHNSPVTCLTFTRDGRGLLSGSQDRTVRLWDLSRTRPGERTTWHGHVAALDSLALAPDRAVLVSDAWDATSRLWSLSGEWPWNASVISRSGGGALAFTPDGRLLAAGDANQLRLWDMTGPAPNQMYFLSVSPRNFRLALAADGKTVVVWGSGAPLEVWDLSRPRPLQEPTLPKDQQSRLVVDALALSPDGKVLVTGKQSGDEAMRAWRRTPTGLKELALPPSRARNVALSPDGGTLAFAGSEAAIHLWDVSGPVPVERMVLEGHPVRGWGGTVKDVTFSPDGRWLASTGLDHRVVVWDTHNGQKRYTWQMPGEVGVLAFASDSRHLALGNANGTIYILRLDAAAK